MKKIFVVLLMLLVIISGTYLVIKLNAGKGGTNNINPEGKPGQALKHEKEITLYYANIKYAETADENLEKVLPLKKKILYDTDESLYKEILNKLKEDPGVEGMNTQIPKEVKLIDVKIKDKIAYVNYSGEGLIGGSLREILAIDQIIYTMTGLEGINGVQLLVDGSSQGQFMGHVDITKPFYKIIEIKPSELDISGMKLNVKRAEFVKTFGNPKKSTFSKNKRKEFLEYQDFKAVISNGVTYEISTTSDKYQTPGKIKVGTDKKVIMAAYGEASSIVNSADGSVEKYTYQIGSDGLIDIEITNGKATMIGIRKFE